MKNQKKNYFNYRYVCLAACAAVSLVASCRTRSAVVIFDSGISPDGSGESAPQGAATGKPDAALTAGESQEKCLGNFLHLEAHRRKVERALIPLYREAQRRATLMKVIDFSAAEATTSKFKLILDRLSEITSGILNQSEIELVTNIVRNRLSAFASCLSLATKSDKWCAELGRAWQEESLDCYINYGIYVLVAGEVISGKKSCREAMQRLEAFGDDDIKIPFCEALAGAKPELCPGEESSTLNVLCRSAATRGATHICRQGKFGDSYERNYRCCELFGWRFGSVVSGSADAYVIPERGALSGDTKGCHRALRWGLFADLVPVFGYEIPAPTDQSSPYEYTRYLCPQVIYWSLEEPP